MSIKEVFELIQGFGTTVTVLVGAYKAVRELFKKEEKKKDSPTSPPPDNEKE